MSVLDSARLLAEEQSAHDDPATAMDIEDDTEWVNDVYTQLNGTPMHNGSTRWQRLNKYRLFIGLFSFALVCAGVGVAVPRSSCVSSLMPSSGIDCSSVTTLSYVVAGLLCLTGLVGCLACYKGLRLSFSCCLAVLFFCYAVLCGTSVVFVVYSRLNQLDNLEAGWRRLVSVGSPVVCDIQKTLGCSGFVEGQCCNGAPMDEEEERSSSAPVAAWALGELPACFRQALNGSTYDLNEDRAVLWPQTMCLPSCMEWNAKAVMGCEAPLKRVVKDYFFHFVLMLTALTVLFGVLGGVTVVGMFWKPSIDSRMQHRF